MNELEEGRPRLTHEERARLYDVLWAIDEIVDLDRLVPAIEVQTGALIGVESSTILLFDRETAQLYAPPSPAAGAEPRPAGRRFPADRGIAGAVLQRGEVEHVAVARRDPRWCADVDGAGDLAVRSLVCAPLRGQAHPLGVLALRNKRAGEFTAADLRLAEAAARHVARLIERAQMLGAARAEADRLRAQVERLQAPSHAGLPLEVVGESGAMHRVFQLIDRAAGLSVPVLVTGDKGAGKALIARAIHAGGARRERPFVGVTCSGMGDRPLFDELFGRRGDPGAGATADARGLFDAAEGGTLFLDDVTAMPAATQAALLRVLSEGRSGVAGDATRRAFDVRIIAATDRDLAAAVRDGTFDADLASRLSAIAIDVPPLRERREDIPLLAARFLERTLRQFERPAIQFTPAALTRLCDYDWPGNVRELQREVERAVVLTVPGKAIDCESLSEGVRSGGTPLSPSASAAAGTNLRRARHLFERDFIARVLAQNGGNASRAAHALGISRVMLHKKLRAYGMRRMDLVRASA